MDEDRLFKLLFIFFAFLWIIFFAKGQEAKAEAVSTEQELRLVIPAAIEVDLRPRGKVQYSGREIKQSYLLKIRANTTWQASFSLSSSFSKGPLYPSTIGGPSNKDNNFQEHPFSLTQPLSWADSGNTGLVISYSITPSL